MRLKEKVALAKKTIAEIDVKGNKRDKVETGERIMKNCPGTTCRASSGDSIRSR